MIEHITIRNGSMTDGLSSVALDTDLLIDFHLQRQSKWEKLAQRKSGMSYFPINLEADPIESARLIYKVIKETGAKKIGICGCGPVEIIHSKMSELDVFIALGSIAKLVSEHCPKDIEFWLTGNEGVETMVMALAYKNQITLKLVTDEYCTAIDNQGLEYQRKPAEIFQSFERFL